jgi:hypothetical protein
MRNIRNRLKELKKSFPPVKESSRYPKHVRDAALGHLSYEDLLVIRSLAKAQEEQSPAPPWNEQQIQAVKKYNTALALITEGLKKSRKKAQLEWNAVIARSQSRRTCTPASPT